MEGTIEERLQFAHACTGEPLFAQALQQIEQLKEDLNVALEDRKILEEQLLA